MRYTNNPTGTKDRSGHFQSGTGLLTVIFEPIKGGYGDRVMRVVVKDDSLFTRTYALYELPDAFEAMDMSMEKGCEVLGALLDNIGIEETLAAEVKDWRRLGIGAPQLPQPAFPAN